MPLLDTLHISYSKPEILQNSKIKEQSATENNHLLCYQPTIHIYISKICPKLQVLTFYFSEVNELLKKH